MLQECAQVVVVVFFASVAVQRRDRKGGDRREVMPFTPAVKILSEEAAKANMAESLDERLGRVCFLSCWAGNH